MDAYYFKEQIHDELHGAKAYIKRAIEFKAMNPTWAKTFAEMSAGELEHASHLYKMFQEYYSKLASTYEKIPEYIEEINCCILDEYTECSAKVKYLHDMFKQ